MTIAQTRAARRRIKAEYASKFRRDPAAAARRRARKEAKMLAKRISKKRKKSIGLH